MQLVGYAKTDTLEAGSRQTLSVYIDRSQLAAYDSHGAGTYILDAGTYYLSAGTNAHDAINNILAAKGKSLADGMTAAGNAAMTATYIPPNTTVDTTTYSTDTYSGNAIANRFAQASGDSSYLTRSDWEGTFPTHDGDASTHISTWGNEINRVDSDGRPVLFTWTKVANDQLLAQLDSKDSGNPVSIDPIYGHDNGLTLAHMRGLDFDDPQWELLLD